MELEINSEIAQYFFGSLFDVGVVNAALNGIPYKEKTTADLIEATAQGRPYFGLAAICYSDLDTGLFVSAMKSLPNMPSMVSFYISSNHRFFGGQTLVCVPLQYCLNLVEPTGEHIVYRHTFKEPSFNEEEISATLKSGTDKEILEAMLLIRSRDGYTTIPGMSYVGLTKRSWIDRYAEHVDKALEGSGSALFHKAIREMHGKRVIHVHDVSAFGVSKEEAIAYEKKLIVSSTLNPLGLNMKVG